MIARIVEMVRKGEFENWWKENQGAIVRKFTFGYVVSPVSGIRLSRQRRFK